MLLCLKTNKKKETIILNYLGCLNNLHMIDGKFSGDMPFKNGTLVIEISLQWHLLLLLIQR